MLAKISRGFFVCLLLSKFLLACTNAEDELQNAPLFLPPTLASTPTPATSPTPIKPLASPTPVCENSLVYAEDLTIPDGTIVSPGEMIDKQWLVVNNGTCNWDAGYTIRWVSEQKMSDTGTQPLYPARSGTQATVQVSLTAPEETGNFRSVWQAHDPDGQPFGETLFIDIRVSGSNP